MKNKFLTLSLLVTVSLIASACISQKPKTREAVVSNDQSQEMMEAKAINYPYQAILKDVAGGVSTGEAMAGFIDNEYKMIASFEDLPDLEGTDFYEGWVVRKSPMSVISTGIAEKDTNGQYVNIFTDSKDLTDHKLYVLTLEPDDGDPAPAAHIVEGSFQVLEKSE